ncbi:MAG: hypothetical protein JW760_02305 [Spirochaetales bacterium]|nr:hypothetical protein [Spirochaetales bacterium]
MVKSELIRRSPLRIFEKSIHGGLGKGNIGVIASRKGVGKTACLVHIATDKLLQDKQVLHVSFSARVDHIITWYEDIFREISRKRNLESAVEVHDELVKKRIIMNFNQKGMGTEHILQSLRAMIKDGHFAADCVIFDGYDIDIATSEDIKAIGDFARETNLEIWFSLSLKGEEPLFDDRGLPRVVLPYLDAIAVLVTLRFIEGYVHLQVVKDRDTVDVRDMNLRLDPKTLLIAEIEE